MKKVDKEEQGTSISDSTKNVIKRFIGEIKKQKGRVIVVTQDTALMNKLADVLRAANVTVFLCGTKDVNLSPEGNMFISLPEGVAKVHGKKGYVVITHSVMVSALEEMITPTVIIAVRTDEGTKLPIERSLKGYAPVVHIEKPNLHTAKLVLAALWGRLKAAIMCKKRCSTRDLSGPAVQNSKHQTSTNNNTNPKRK